MTDAGDGGPAAQALLNAPMGVVEDSGGAMYIADASNHKIRKVSPDGTITTFAGTGVVGWSGDGGPAINATLWRPMNPAVGPDGSIYFADLFNRNVRRVAPDGTISTIAGNGSTTDYGDGGPATEASLSYPTAVAIDSAGNVYIAELSRVRRIDGATGIIATYLGGGTDPYDTYCCVTGIAVDSNSNVYIGDGSASTIFKIAPDGSQDLVARGIGADTIAVDGDGTIYFAQSYVHFPFRPGIWKIGADGILQGFLLGSFYPASLGFTSAGLLVSLSSSLDIATSEGLQLFAGAGLSGFAGDGEPSDLVRFRVPSGVAADPAGNVYVVDRGNARIRKISVDGAVSTFAGSGVLTSSGDAGPATSAGFSPTGIAAGPAGDIFIADFLNNRVRRVDVSGMITTYAGNGGFGTVASPPKDGAPAISTAITPSGIASDARGNLYIADMRSGTFLRITVDGIVHLLHGLPRYLSFDSMSIPIAAGPNDSAYVGLGSWIFRFGADGDFEVFEPALKLSPPETSLGAVVYNALAFDASGTLYASLNFPTGLFSLSADGVVATYLGYGRIGMSTADGPAINSESVAKGLTLDLAGNIYLSDSLASRIRVIPAGCQPPILP